MQLLAQVNAENGHFVARLTCWPEYHVSGNTRQAALDALFESVNKKLDEGEIHLLDFTRSTIKESSDRTEQRRPAFINLNARSIRDLAGIFKDDPTLDQLREDIYRERDEERKREFGE